MMGKEKTSKSQQRYQFLFAKMEIKIRNDVVAAAVVVVDAVVALEVTVERVDVADVVVVATDVIDV